MTGHELIRAVNWLWQHGGGAVIALAACGLMVWAFVAMWREPE